MWHAGYRLLYNGPRAQVISEAAARGMPDARVIGVASAGQIILGVPYFYWERVYAWWLQCGNMVRTLGPGE